MTVGGNAEEELVLSNTELIFAIRVEKMTLVLLSVLLRPAFLDLRLCDTPQSYDSSSRESKTLIKEYESSSLCTMDGRKKAQLP